MFDEKAIQSIVEKAKRYDELKRFPTREIEVTCSFCGKSQSAVNKIIAAKTVAICNECVELCVEILEEEKEQKEEIEQVKE